MNLEMLFIILALIGLALATGNFTWPRFHPGWAALFILVLLRLVGAG